jgi:carbamoyl-phosphate synthase small subunit
MALNIPTPGTLVLADGKFFEGHILGSDKGFCGGELCFNTGMTGYQEMFTDPSYRGQLLIHNFVHLGNYGVCTSDTESDAIQISGVISRNFSSKHSRLKADSSLNDELISQGVMGIEGIDTRALVRHIRNYGAMNAVIVSASAGSDRLELGQQALGSLPQMSGLNLAHQVSTRETYGLSPLTIKGAGVQGSALRVAVMDYGVKRNMLRNLQARGCELMVFPSSSTLDQVLGYAPHGVMLSNGPGDPSSMDAEVQVVQGLVDRLPVFGICLGHQLLARAGGLETFKMHNGHRGSNHPVRNLKRNHSEITAQNHGFAVKMEALSDHPELELTHINLNDGTVEGLAWKNRPVFSVQYHPEANPGPHDSLYLFDDFVKNMKV